jgi:TonB family protein
MNKPLYLRGCWKDDNLDFDSAGRLQKASEVVSFTLSGFELQKISLDPDQLILEGRRIVLELNNDKQNRIPISLDTRNPNHPKDESMKISIKASPDGDYGLALNAIFVADLADLIPSQPLFWKEYANKNFARPGTPNNSAAATVASEAPASAQQSSPRPVPLHVGGTVKAPELRQTKMLVFNDSVRRLTCEGTVLLNLWVEPDGTVSDITVVHAMGIGFDESAQAAVQQYKYAPAKENGRSVLVELNLPVHIVHLGLSH